MEIDEIIREEIKNMEPYKPAAEKWNLKLDANESPFDIPDEIKAEIWQATKKNKFCLYYDPTSREVREGLARYCGINPECIIIGNGSDEIIMNLIFGFAGPGREVIIPSPTFPVYEMFTIISGAKPIKIPLIERNGQQWQLDTDRIKSVFSDKPQMLFICYPNNPTGNYYPEQEVLELIKNFNGLVVIDEAYYEFGHLSFIKYLDKLPNVAIIRTFSKAFCMAGLRLGYLIANEEIIEHIYRIKMPYNINLFSQRAGKVILNHTDMISRIAAKLNSYREDFAGMLKCVDGVTPYTSDTNFILCRFDVPAEKVYKALREDGVAVRAVAGQPFCLRVSVGLPEQNCLFVDKLKSILS